MLGQMIGVEAALLVEFDQPQPFVELPVQIAAGAVHVVENTELHERFPFFGAWYDRPMADVLPETLPTEEALSGLCRRWLIKELSLFGSLARGDAGPASDADVLVTFQSDEHWDLWDMVDLRDELAGLFRRPVDVVVEGAIRNPIRWQTIMRDKRRLYAG